jgi:hypothetical protein
MSDCVPAEQQVLVLPVENHQCAEADEESWWVNEAHSRTEQHVTVDIGILIG